MRVIAVKTTSLFFKNVCYINVNNNNSSLNILLEQLTLRRFPTAYELLVIMSASVGRLEEYRRPQKKKTPEQKVPEFEL